MHLVENLEARRGKERSDVKGGSNEEAIDSPPLPPEKKCTVNPQSELPPCPPPDDRGTSENGWSCHLLLLLF